MNDTTKDINDERPFSLYEQSYVPNRFAKNALK